MYFKHFLQDLESLARNISPYADINIDGMEVVGGDVFFELGQTGELDEAKEELEKANGEFKGLEEEKEGLEKTIEELEKKIGELVELTEKYQANSGETMKELLDDKAKLEERLSFYTQQNQSWRDSYEVQKKEIEKLRGRINKATVERNYTDGKFYCEYKGVKYQMVPVEVK